MSTSPQAQNPADVPGGGCSSAEGSAQPQQLIAGDDGEDDGDCLMQLKSVVSFTSATGDCAVEGCESGASNRFRSNIEIVEKPRQMIVLMATIAGASYLVRV